MINELKTLTPEEVNAFRQQSDVKSIKPISLSDEEWRQRLSSSEYRVLRQSGTEQSWRNEYNDEKTEGVYHCRGCHHPLFGSDAKYDSGSGWPSFWKPLSGISVKTKTDNSWIMSRTEVLCARCESHLGHVFEDGPQPTGQRYCMNSTALRLMPGKINE